MQDMAGLEDYRYYAMLEKDSPFWEKRHHERVNESTDLDSPRSPYEDRFGNQKVTRPHKLDLSPVVVKDEPNPSRMRHVRSSSGYSSRSDLVSYIPWLQTGLCCVESIISHPWVVIRRQCQVHGSSARYHIFSPTLIPVIVTLNRAQGFSTMFKGVGSTVLLQSTSLWIEDFLSKVTPWPKSLQGCHSLRGLGQHIILKCISVAVITPFYSASLVETVQSDIASETPGCLDVFKEGLIRMLSWATPQTGRLLPVWVLVVPTVMYGVGQYFLSSTVQSILNRITSAIHRHKHNQQGALPKEEDDIKMFFEQQFIRLIGCAVADIVFYPLETVLNRLHLQGTRTIVDNLDTGTSVIPILNQYDGILDCWRTIKVEEGRGGLWKGFGAVVIQYTILFSLVKIGKIIHEELTGASKLKKMKESPPSDIKGRQVESTSKASPQKKHLA